MAFLGKNGVFAWADMDGTGTPHVDEGYNASSITDLGTGKYKLNFSANAPNANYAIIGSNIGETNDDHTYTFVCSREVNTETDGAEFSVTHRSGSLRDQNKISLIVVGRDA